MFFGFSGLNRASNWYYKHVMPGLLRTNTPIAIASGPRASTLATGVLVLLCKSLLIFITELRIPYLRLCKLQRILKDVFNLFVQRNCPYYAIF